MAKNLLIVESPAKAKTINKYLGSDFEVLASFGHIRDLPKKNGSIDVDNDFKPKFQIIAKNKKRVDEIISGAKNSENIYLATDPDREGEAIAWHINEVLKANKSLGKKNIKRVTFNEITKGAISQAVKHPREIDFNLVDAQQARLALDYLIGFNISPVLWRKVKSGLSAGRVQSPALRLICEREKEIKEFVVEDYYSIHLHTAKAKTKINAKLIEYGKKKIETRTIATEKEAQKICKDLAVHKETIVSKITKKEKLKNPLAPFITSTLQIDGARKCGFNTDKTMKIAQGLYEGVDIGSDTIGLITYMRTDSVNLSEVAIEEIRAYIGSNYAKEYLPKNPVKYTSKIKNAQEAHEAIRPTSIERTPSSVKKYLTADQFKLYELIWLRTLASQIAPAILDTTSIDFKVDNAIFRANGVTIKFDGFMKVYQEAFEDTPNDDNELKLPNLEVDEKLKIDKIDAVKHQTEPKPRYSEASLVKALEELGIGRPSTYTSIILTLKKREYVIMDKKRFIPTDVGSVVNQFLTQHMTQYVDYQFTANLEDTLDDISNGSKPKLPMLNKFWKDLQKVIADTQSVSKADVVNEVLDEKCPKCSKDLISRLGKYGRFIGCSGYPDCDYMRKIDGDTQTEITREEPEVVEGRTCPKDGGVLVIRTGRYGKFISCKNYPKCKHIENLDNPNPELGVKCPVCKQGDLAMRKNRYGNFFYSCNRYPDCKTLYNHKPLNQTCPVCKYPVMLDKTTKKFGHQHVCANPECGHTIDLE